MRVTKSAFTMSEILISLTIIGIIAAITLPALRNNINATTWNTQRKALYSRLSQAISMMPSVIGYGIGSTDAETASNAAEAFITNGLSKVLEIKNICRSDKLKDCGIPKSYTNLTGNSKFDFPTNLGELNEAFLASDYLHATKTINTDAAAFETKNGESVAVYYNPICLKDFYKKRVFINAYMCANFIYDLNGRKGPNKVGKDIGAMTVFSPTDSVLVAPVPLAKNANGKYGTTGRATETHKYCRLQDKNSRVPNIEELMSMFYNRHLFNIDGYYWSGYKVDSQYYFAIAYLPNDGARLYRDSFIYYSSLILKCVKK